MKKLIILGALTLAVVLASNQQASAWSNIKFGVGMNLHWQAGDNTLLWGVFRNGQIPCPSPYGGGPGPYGPGYGGPGGNFPMYYEPTAAEANKQQAAAPAPAPIPPSVNQTNYNGNYQPVGYYPNTQYQVPMYVPGYNPYQQAPPYWYGQ
jgi:hypothetical protein